MIVVEASAAARTRKFRISADDAGERGIELLDARSNIPPASDEFVPGLFCGEFFHQIGKKSDAERHKNSERRRLKATLRIMRRRSGEPSSRRNLLVFFFLVSFVERPRPTTALTSAHRENAFIGYSEKKQIRFCVDSIQMCSDWAKNGECAKNPGYMSENCCCGATLFFGRRRLCLVRPCVSLSVSFALSAKSVFLSLCFCRYYCGRARRRLTDDDTVTIFKLSLAKQRATRSVPRRPTTRRRKK